ncbi:hypothetical protein J7M02_05665 [Candidatus Aerophobetes bacterium]|nr:hypothetical protein [Candidatus Aerophobetes bacterium]
MARFEDVIRAINEETLISLFEKPLFFKDQRALANILQKMGIKKLANIVGRYFDEDIDDEFRDFIDGEISLLYKLTGINEELDKEKGKVGVGVDFKDVIERIDEDVLFNIFSQGIPEEDKEASFEKLGKVGIKKWISTLAACFDKAQGTPDFQRFIRGVASCLFHIARLKDTVEMEKQLGL